MDSQNSSDLQIATHLAKPFLLPGYSGQPLSFRALPDGGMVVIAPDGRKLWFTVKEVTRACKDLKLRAPAKPAAAPGAEIQQLHEPDRTCSLSQVSGRSSEGNCSLIVLPPDLRYLKERTYDHSQYCGKPRPRSTG